MKRSIYFCLLILLLGAVIAWFVPLRFAYRIACLPASIGALVITIVVCLWIGHVRSWSDLLSLLRRKDGHTMGLDLTNLLILSVSAALTYLGLMFIYSYRVDRAFATRGVIALGRVTQLIDPIVEEETGITRHRALTISYPDSLTQQSYTTELKSREVYYGELAKGQAVHVVYLPEDPTLVRALVGRKDIEKFMGQTIRPLELPQLSELLGKAIEDVEQTLSRFSYGWEPIQQGDELWLINRYTNEMIQHHCDRVLYQSDKAWELLKDALPLSSDDEQAQRDERPCAKQAQQQFVYDGRVHIYLEEHTSISRGNVLHVHRLHLYPMCEEPQQGGAPVQD